MNATQVAQTAVSWVRRARAGDQVAMAALRKTRVDVESGKATPQERIAYQAASKYIKANPVGKSSSEARRLGAPVEMSAEGALVDADATTMLRRRRADNRPPIPRGLLRGLGNAETLAETVMGASQYKDGTGACVVALAAGAPLVPAAIDQISTGSKFGEPQSAAFAHGARFCGEADWAEAAPAMPRELRPCMLVGQCVGRAAKLQALRQPDSTISDYDPIIGWELGE